MQNTHQKSKEEFWNAHIVGFNQSGKSRRQYCLTENLSYRTFLNRTKKNETAKDTNLVKIPAHVHAQTNDRQSFIEIIIAQKISIRVAQDFDGRLLRDVVRELGIEL